MSTKAVILSLIKISQSTRHASTSWQVTREKCKGIFHLFLLCAFSNFYAISFRQLKEDGFLNRAVLCNKWCSSTLYNKMASKRRLIQTYFNKEDLSIMNFSFPTTTEITFLDEGEGGTLKELISLSSYNRHNLYADKLSLR